MVSLRLRRAAQATVVALLALLASGCEDDGSGTTDATGSSSGAPGVTVTGRERLAWEQEAPSQAEIDSYRFTVFVDGSPAGPLAASCSAAGGTGTYTCAANLPSLTPGTHRLAIQTTASNGASSGVSADLAVVMQGAGMAASFVTALSNVLPLSLAQVCIGSQPSPRCFELERVATQLTAPTDPTELPDGRLLFLDDGRLMEVQEGRVRAVVGAPEGARIADISVAPDSAATREVFLLEVNSRNVEAGAADVVRYREINGVLGERAVIVPDIAVPPGGEPVLSVDDQILVGIPQQDDPGGRRFGTVLRYDRRGASAGYRVGTPVLAWGAGQPTAMFKSGDTVAVAGLSTGSVTFGMLAPGATTPASLAVTDRLTAAGGVRAIQQVGDLVLIATGDGSLQMGTVDGQGGMPATLQRLDTRGVAVTGLEATRDGGVVGTATIPSLTGGPIGVMYRLAPVPTPAHK